MRHANDGAGGNSCTWIQLFTSTQNDETTTTKKQVRTKKHPIRKENFTPTEENFDFEKFRRVDFNQDRSAANDLAHFIQTVAGTFEGPNISSKCGIGTRGRIQQYRFADKTSKTNCHAVNNTWGNLFVARFDISRICRNHFFQDTGFHLEMANRQVVLPCIGSRPRV